MRDSDKNKAQLIGELIKARQQVAELEATEAERQPVEAALRESEENYRTLVDNALVGIYRTNLRGDVLYVNDTEASMLGFDSVAEMIAGGAVVIYKNQNDRKILLEELTEKGKVNSFEVEILTKTGETKNVIMNAVLEGDTISGMLMDITRRKRAEVLFQTMFDSSPAGIFIIQDGKFKLVNSRFLQLTGYNEAELLDKEPLSFVLAEDRDMVRENAAKMFHGERSLPYEYRLVDRGGKVRWIMAMVTSIQYQGRRAVLGSYMDITEHKQAEKALEVQKELTDRILASTPSAILVIDRDLEIVLANRMFASTFNLTKEEVAGKPVGDVLPIAGLESLISRALTDGQPQLDLEFRHKIDSRSILLVVQIVPMAGEAILLILRDVTAERARKEQQQHIDRLASIGEVAAGVAHEVNNPLSVVLGYAELLLDAEVSSEVKSDVAVIHHNAQRAVAIVRNLLAFARRQEPQKRSLSINDLVGHVLEVRGYELKVNNIEVTAELAADIPEVIADPQQLEQVFLNVILNAEQAMLKARNRGNLTISAGLAGDLVRIAFTDDGPGIPEENLARVFDPFFTTGEPGKSTGLGLSICHGIITEHGGRMYARSTPGEGATFYIDLPVAEGG